MIYQLRKFSPNIAKISTYFFATAAAHLNADLAALCDYGHHWNIAFAFKDIIISDFIKIRCYQPSTFIS